MAKASKNAPAPAAAPSATVFNVLQFIALGALIASVALLWLALAAYDFKLTAG